MKQEQESTGIVRRPGFTRTKGDVLAALAAACFVLGGGLPARGQMDPAPDLNITLTNSGYVVSWTGPASTWGWLAMSLETTEEFSSESSWSQIRPPMTLDPVGTCSYRFSCVAPGTNAQQFFRLRTAAYTHIFQYAVFYDELLEWTRCVPLTINGRVHSNGDIYTGSPSVLIFKETVTAGGSVDSPAWAGVPTNYFTGPVDYAGTPACITNVHPVGLPTGTNNPHWLIDRPPDGESPLSFPGSCRLYNQAHIVFVVSNSSVIARIQSGTPGQLPGADPDPIVTLCPNTAAALATSFPFLTTSNRFTDQRESKTILTTQVDVGIYANWLRTNEAVLAKFPAGSDSYPTILFVSDNRTLHAAELTAVRLTNGSAPPENGGHGFTLVTPNPLYVWGHFNCTNTSHLGTTNTSATVPCALMSDAITLLSSNWRDNQSSWDLGSPGKNTAVNMTVNAAVLTGIVPSSGPNYGQFSGGVHNVFRLLEGWGNGYRTLTLNTSIAILFASAHATTQFRDPGDYYYAPTRLISFDPNFSKPGGLPPGTPTVSH